MQVRLITFGSLGATMDGAELHGIVSQRIRAALLVYLAIERSATRATLEAIFWPEIDSESAARRLTQTIYAIRQDLGDDVIETRGHVYRATDQLQVDALDFQKAVDAGNQEVIPLYLGPFLQGVHLIDSNEFENWLSSRRTRYARQFRKACRAEIDACISRGDLAAALKTAQLWVAPDPLDDEAQHSLIELLARVVGRKQARDQYDTYCQLLEADDLQPLEETRELIAAIERETEALTFSPLNLPLLSRPQSPGSTQLEIAKDPADPIVLASDLAQDINRQPRSSVGARLRGFIRKHPRVAAVVAVSVALVSLFAATPFGRQAFAQLLPRAPKYIAVLPFSSTDPSDKALAAGLTQAFTNVVADFAASNQSLWVLESSDMMNANVTTPAEVRRIYPVDFVVVGQLRRDGDEVALGLTLLDVRGDSARPVNSLTVPRPSDFDSDNSVQALMARALRLRKPQPSAEGADRSARATSPAQRYYFLGLGHRQLAYDMSSLEPAFTLFRTALTADSTYGPAYGGLCQAFWDAYVRTGEVSHADSARANCDRAVALSRSDPSALLSLGKTQFFTGQTEQAVATLRAAVRRNAGAEAHRWLGKALEEQGKFGEAARAYRQAIQLRDDIWAYHSDLGLMYTNSGQHEQAVVLHREAARLSPNNPRPYNDLGASLMFLNQLDAAADAFQLSIKARPTTYAYRNFGYLYLRDRRYDEAVAVLDQGISYSQKDWWSWRWLAHAQHWRGDEPGALRSWRRVVQLIEPRLEVNPRELDLLCGLAEALVALGERQTGNQHLSFLATLKPTQSHNLYWAGRVFEMLGNRRSAVEFINQAIGRGFDARTAATDPWLVELRNDPLYNGPR